MMIILIKSTMAAIDWGLNVYLFNESINVSKFQACYGFDFIRAFLGYVWDLIATNWGENGEFQFQFHRISFSFSSRFSNMYTTQGSIIETAERILRMFSHQTISVIWWNHEVSYTLGLLIMRIGMEHLVDSNGPHKKRRRNETMKIAALVITMRRWRWRGQRVDEKNENFLRFSSSLAYAFIVSI